MRALTYADFGGPIIVGDVPTPTPPPGGAVVRVHASGLCRSDWHAWAGHDDDITTLPHVPGHEFAGMVEGVGDGVDWAWLGQMVTAPFVQACGACEECRRGDGQVCPHQRQPGFTDPGSFAEYVVVHAASTNLVALPAGLTPAVAAGLGCRVATSYRAMVHRARVQAGEQVAVFGCGGVGLAAIAVAASRGARVIAVDTAPEPLALAAAAGAQETVLAGPSTVDEVIARTGGGAHVTVDAVGSAAILRDAVLSLRRRGRHIQIGLLPPAAGRPEVPMGRVIGWELDLLGSHGMAASDYPELLADIVSGELSLAALGAPGEPMSLAEAAVALPLIGTSASPGLAVADPRR